MKARKHLHRDLSKRKGLWTLEVGRAADLWASAIPRGLARGSCDGQEDARLIEACVPNLKQPADVSRAVDSKETMFLFVLSLRPPTAMAA